jgi:phosphoribosylformimino-5-aminoimidazole carboxamide ribotide isomerase
MIAIPAVDLREGACVQLVGGAYEDERVRLADPVGVARRWRACGFRVLHVVDLDAATGRGENRATVEALLAEPGLEVQAGGGVRDETAIERLLARGAARVVVGTRALEDAAWLTACAARFPGRLLVAVDARAGRVATHGWTRTQARDAVGAVRGMADLPLAGVLVTAVEREGRLAGPDLELAERAAAAAPFPLHASGGIASPGDLRALRDRGVSAAVLGMALYTGALDAGAIAKEFGG